MMKVNSGSRRAHGAQTRFNIWDWLWGGGQVE